LRLPVIPAKGSPSKRRGRNPSLLFTVDTNIFPQKRGFLELLSYIYKHARIAKIFGHLI